MQSNERRSRLLRAWATLAGVGLVASCSVYQPLDQGSDVPWAQAHQGGGRIASADGVPRGGIYVVRSGDRLGGLADRYGLSVPQLAQANHLRPPYTIRVGQVLRIPEGGPGAGPDRVMVAQSARRSTVRRCGSQVPACATPRPGARPLRAGRSRRWRWPSCRRRPGANLAPAAATRRHSPRSRQRPPVSAIPCARAKPCPGSRSASMSA